MEGVFLKKKFSIWLCLLFICGLFLIGLNVFLIVVDKEAAAEIPILLIFGILVCLGVVPFWFFNFGAYFRVEEDSVKAKYHWFGRIDCKLSDVTFVEAKVNTLILQLKSGETYTITGIANSWPLAALIRRKIPFTATEQPEVLMEELNQLKKFRKKRLIYV